MSMISTHTSQVHHNKAWNSLEAKGEHILWHSTAAHDRGRVCKLWVHGYALVGQWGEGDDGDVFGTVWCRSWCIPVGSLSGTGMRDTRRCSAALRGRRGRQCWYSWHTGSVPSAGNLRVLITLSILTGLKIWMLLQYCVQAPSFMAGSCTALHKTPPHWVCRCTVHYTMIILIINSIITSQADVSILSQNIDSYGWVSE